MKLGYFHRETGFSTVYIGLSNMSKVAKQKEQNGIAKKLLDIKTIAEKTGLTVEEVEKLKKE